MHAQDLRAKTRIFVPDSALLMGIMDEFGVLKYGEVYLAINPDPAAELPRIITGGVVVAKNPCFHPGDVRRLKVHAAWHEQCACACMCKHVPAGGPGKQKGCSMRLGGALVSGLALCRANLGSDIAAAGMCALRPLCFHNVRLDCTPGGAKLQASQVSPQGTLLTCAQRVHPLLLNNGNSTLQAGD